MRKVLLLFVVILTTLNIYSQQSYDMFSPDKLNHFAAGLVIGNSGGLFLKTPEHRIVYALGTSCLIATLKETRDYNRYGFGDPLDIVATMAGAMAGALIINTACKISRNFKKPKRHRYFLRGPHTH